MNRVRELRKLNKLTQQRLADDLHVARTTVTMWEKGTKPDIDVMPRIAEYFNVSVDYLLGLTDECACSSSIHPVQLESALTDDEKILLKRYRSLNDDCKELLRAEALRLSMDSAQGKNASASNVG